MAPAASAASGPVSGRWLQLIIGIVCMVMIANLQYGWTLFVGPIDAKYHWGRAAIQVAFSIFVLTETWLVPIEGWFVDRFGPRIVVVVGGVLVGIACIFDGQRVHGVVVGDKPAIQCSGQATKLFTSIGKDVSEIFTEPHILPGMRLG